MPTFTRPRPGVSSVGQYQMSARPWSTASFEVPAIGSTPLEISFPTVTSWVWVSNLDSNIPVRLGFSANGTSGSLAGGENNYIYIANESQSPLFKVRCRSIFLLSGGGATEDVTVMAGLTGIDSELRGDDGANFSGSNGVG